MEFTNFFAFSALLFLPLLFYLIKLFPPAPKKVFFSSLFLIKKIEKPKVFKNKFPLWLLIFRIILVLMVIGGIFIFFFGSELIIFIFGSEYSSVGNYIKILILGTIIFGPASTLTSYFSAIGKASILPKLQLVPVILIVVAVAGAIV